MPARMKNASASHMLLPLLQCLAPQVYFFLVQNISRPPHLSLPSHVLVPPNSVIISIKKEVYIKAS